MAYFRGAGAVALSCGKRAGKGVLMKRVVVATGLHESDIRPRSLISEFKRLSLIDASNYFSDPAKRVDIDCPACGCSDKTPAFRKNTFLYNVCQTCQSLYVSPRPDRDALAEYYETSRASHYRVEHFEQQTAEARRVHQLRLLANWLGQLVDEQGNPAAKGYADIGTHSPQIFQEVQELDLFEAFHAISPLPGLDASCDAMGVQVAREPLTGLGAITALTKIENHFSPVDLFRSAHEMLADGGLFFLTTRTVSGFDLQVLWDKTPYIFVPEHLNLVSIAGITELAKRSGFAIIELSTPGQLDLELTFHAAQEDPSIELPAFVWSLIRHPDGEARADFQAFLQKHRLSSHLRIAVKKEARPGKA